MESRKKRDALLIRCSAEEATAIREAARNSGRTLSGYVLHCLRNRLRIEARIQAEYEAIAARSKQTVPAELVELLSGNTRKA